VTPTFELNSPRLSIRPWRPEDRPALEQMTGDAEMMRHITSGQVWTNQQVDALLDRQAQHLARHGICIGAIWLKSARQIIGLAGLQQHDDGLFELGWWVWKAHWRQGFASEAALACVEHARAVMQLDCLVAIIDPPNIASRRVAEKIGMRHVDIRSAQETMAWREDIPVDYFRLDLAVP
jgi:RimJ/RimL family protein N-acetyltransferase